MVRVHLVVSGQVQGVFFRASAQAEAERLALQGWVRNRQDGTVEIVAEGPADRVQVLVDWCREGPQMARVDALEQRRSEPVGLEGFDVRPTC